MCGIFGICYTDKSKASEEWTPTELAQIMFPAIVHRGPHAFGWMTWDGTGEVQVEKHEGDVELLDNLNRVSVDENATWMIGHVRWATNGATDYAPNNHPIIHGDIVGVHNGIISNFEEVLAETGGREDPKAEVDSEAIFAAIDRWGHKPGLRRIKGNLAVAYTRKSSPSNVWFAKSNGRPLVFARTKAGSLVFASELGVLRAVWGNDLTDIRKLQEGQLVRVVDGLVSYSEMWDNRPPVASLPVSRPSQKTILPKARAIEAGGDYFDRLREEMRLESYGVHNETRGVKRGNAYFDRRAAEDNHPTPRMSKKQKKRAHRAESARRFGPEGFFWWQGRAVTREEYEILTNQEEIES